MVAVKDYPHHTELIELIVNYLEKDKVFHILNEVDKYNRTLFDIPDQIVGSCLLGTKLRLKQLVSLI